VINPGTLLHHYSLTHFRVTSDTLTFAAESICRESRSTRSSYTHKRRGKCFFVGSQKCNRHVVYFLFQTFAVFWMSYAFFWVIPRLLNFIQNSSAGKLPRRKHTTLFIALEDSYVKRADGKRLVADVRWDVSIQGAQVATCLSGVSVLEHYT
jgi:hypothetical protein